MNTRDKAIELIKENFTDRDLMVELKGSDLVYQAVLKTVQQALNIDLVSDCNIAIGDYVWYNERIHKVQKIRFDDEFWQGKEIAIIDIQAKDTKDVPTRVLRYVR